MDLSTVMVNVAYATYVGSTFFREIFRLRLMLIASSVAFLIWGIADDNASVIVWNVVFGTVSTYQVLRLLRVRRAVVLTDLEAEIRRDRFAGMSNHDFLLFWEMGTAGEATDERLVVEGDHHGRLLLITDGDVVVRRANRELRRCATGDFIGEMSLLSTEPASADVVALGAVRYREWTHDRIAGLARSEPALSDAIRASLASGLTRKLGVDR